MALQIFSFWLFCVTGMMLAKSCGLLVVGLQTYEVAKVPAGDGERYQSESTDADQNLVSTVVIRRIYYARRLVRTSFGLRNNAHRAYRLCDRSDSIQLNRFGPLRCSQ